MRTMPPSHHRDVMGAILLITLLERGYYVISLGCIVYSINSIYVLKAKGDWVILSSVGSSLDGVG